MTKFLTFILCLSCRPLMAADYIHHETMIQHETIVVEGRQENLIGEAVSASEGVVGQAEIQLRPILRTGEVLELVPGMVATQHSGTGKANQYFLRGFNLDHGTDFATFVDGMPINMRTHGHGQGYTDLSFIIPEVIEKLGYKKGGYYSEIGDFSGAGSAHMSTASSVEHGLFEATIGQDQFQRVLLINSLFTDSLGMAQGDTLVALEHNRYDGPWTDVSEDLGKTNALLKHQFPVSDGMLTLTAMAYDNSWNSADQIPERAVQQGIIDELGSLDRSVGGESSRYSLSFLWEHTSFHASGYLIDYDLNLWSNFTYFLDDELNGDQFEQVDKRIIYGGEFHYHFGNHWGTRNVVNKIGADVRMDDIDEVALYQTQQRQRLGVVRSDAVNQSSLGIFWENRIAWTDHLRTIIGARYDSFDFEVKDKAGVNVNGVDLSVNTGETDDDLFSLKGSLVVSFHEDWEGYISAGQAMHSNDARGTTIRVDPSDGSNVNAVDPLVRSFGYEAGVRGFITDKINTSVSIWALELDSELLFVGDAGNTEASRESERQGIELTAYYRINSEWSLDIEYANTDSEFSDDAPEGNEIPGAIEQVLQAGISAELTNGWFGSLRLRHFGERPLIEDGSVRSDTSSVWNLRIGYKMDHWTVRADLLNLADSDDHDITYFYESRLASEPAGVGVEDVHYHVIEPRTVRLSVNALF